MDERIGARPRVTVHYAQTLDGRLATRTGNSQWISGEESLRLAHRLRAEHQAVLVGIGTVLADNPHLTLRLAAGASPLRAIADSTLRVPLSTNILTDGSAQTLIATTERAPQERIRALRRCGAQVLVLRQDCAGRVDLCHLLQCLAAGGIDSVLIEGGAGLITSALRARLVDRLVVCIAPKVIGSGIDAIGDLNILRLSEAMTFQSAHFTSLGEDAIFEGELQRELARVP